MSTSNPEARKQRVYCLDGSESEEFELGLVFCLDDDWSSVYVLLCSATASRNGDACLYKLSSLNGENDDNETGETFGKPVGLSYCSLNDAPDSTTAVLTLVDGSMIAYFNDGVSFVDAAGDVHVGPRLHQAVNVWIGADYAPVCATPVATTELPTSERLHLAIDVVARNQNGPFAVDGIVIREEDLDKAVENLTMELRADYGPDPQRQ